MNTRKFHEIWVKQCDATHEIKLRYGVKAAFDYLVAEKLLNFADAATSRPEFAKELPRFVAYVRGLFTPQEMRTHLARIEREQTAYAAQNDDEEDGEFDDDDELIHESPAAAAELIVDNSDGTVQVKGKWMATSTTGGLISTSRYPRER